MSVQRTGSTDSLTALCQANKSFFDSPDLRSDGIGGTASGAEKKKDDDDDELSADSTPTKSAQGLFPSEQPAPKEDGRVLRSRTVLETVESNLVYFCGKPDLISHSPDASNYLQKLTAIMKFVRPIATGQTLPPDNFSQILFSLTMPIMGLKDKVEQQARTWKTTLGNPDLQQKKQEEIAQKFYQKYCCVVS